MGQPIYNLSKLDIIKRSRKSDTFGYLKLKNLLYAKNVEKQSQKTTGFHFVDIPYFGYPFSC